MTRVEGILAESRASGRGALMPFVCAGHPSLDATAPLLRAVDAGGASVIEVGFPFSDPIADGPVIAAAMHRALEAGITPGRIFDDVASVRGDVQAGLVAMVSVTLVLHAGPERFVKRAAEAGFDGFIFPDLPVEEAGGLLPIVRNAGLTASLLVAPTTSDQRAERIVRASSGFVYLMARTGITGESGGAPEIDEAVRRLRGMTDLPIACGFGISTPEHVRAVTASADAAIVGSALVRRLEPPETMSGAETPAWAARTAEAFTRELCAGLRAPAPHAPSTPHSPPARSA